MSWSPISQTRHLRSPRCFTPMMLLSSAMQETAPALNAFQSFQCVKFLGVLFDAKLTWRSHINHVRSKINRLKNFFTVITVHSSGPQVKTFLVIYNAPVRGYYDYGLVAYGSSCKTNISLIETATRSFLRLILGSLKSTPVNILYNELGIKTIVMGKEWLAINYVFKACLNFRHSNYALIASLAQSPKIWPSRSTPCLQNAIDLLMRHHPTALSYSNEYYCDYGSSPWIKNQHQSFIIPTIKAGSCWTTTCRPERIPPNNRQFSTVLSCSVHGWLVKYRQFLFMRRFHQRLHWDSRKNLLLGQASTQLS